MKKVGWSSIVVATLVLVFGVAAEAQQPKKIPRIGYLAADPQAPTRDAFRQGLRDFGYVEGQSILIEWRFTQDRPDRFSEFAAELTRLKVDAIVSGNSSAVAILQRTTTTIPIVSSWQPMVAIL
jgi:putative ABC transport system substrate-binding protein